MQLIARQWGIVAGLSGFIAIVMGALGAHAVADAHLAALVETASLYQLIHALALLWLSGQQGKYLPVARWLFLIATMLFCGTLYLKALAGWDGAVRLAPFGGVGFMAGWLVIALAYCRPAAGVDT
jgi:uncharacterized membrane protein YgdD (TMEM256/DUF423 family)